MVWVTQPPWLHQFHFGWTSAHPITKLGVVPKVESCFFWACLSRDFFSLMDLPCWLPHSKNIFPPTSSPCPTFLPMIWIFFQNFISFCHHCHCYNDAIACHHRFREELGATVTSRCEQCEVQHLRKTPK